MITTRDLNLRQKEVKKNLYEMSSTLKAQPVGGTGALIQRPAQNTPAQKRTPILFSPSPMLSSLPYLSDAVKYRSNEVSIMTNAMIAEQRKAKIIYDDVRQQEIAREGDKVLETVARNYQNSTSNLLREYLGGEIDKTRQEERKVQLARMQRLDLDLNSQTQNIQDKAAEEKIRNDAAAADARDQAVRNRFTSLAEARNSQSNMDILRALRKLKEGEIEAKLRESTAPSLKEFVRSLGPSEERPAINIKGELRPASNAELKKKGASIPTIIEAKAKGLIKKIPFDMAGSPLVPTSGAGRPAGGGGGGGGGGAEVATALRQLQKGI
jgi:hypothetical protein